VNQSEIRTAVKTGALHRLGALAAGETAAAADDALADAALDRLVDDMAARGDCAFDKDALPEAAQDGLIDLLAARLADVFGLSLERALRLDAAGEAARREFRRQARAEGADQTVAFSNH